MTRPRLLDLFCCEGGAGAGYHAAGFDVVGVDIRRRDRYPFEFHRADALEFLADQGDRFDAVHASPPCQIHTHATHRNQGARTLELFTVTRHVDLVPQTREMLNAVGRPWVIENVPGARLTDPVTLCGSMFDLGVACRDGWRQLRRHRDFESPVPLLPPGPCRHTGPAVSVYGHGGYVDPQPRKGYTATLAEALIVMGTPWMTLRGVAEAIPPAYTEWLGVQLRDALDWAAA